MLSAQERDETRVRELVEILAAAFGREASERLVAVYTMALAGMDVAAVERGVRLAVSQCDHMPTAVEVRRLAGVLSAHEIASAAWQDVYEAIGRHGRYASVEFEDKRVHAAVLRIGGWQYLCSLRAKDLRGRVRSEFVREHAALVESGVRGQWPQYLLGAHEAQGSVGTKAPVFIKSRCSPKALKPVQLQLRLVDGAADK